MRFLDERPPRSLRSLPPAGALSALRAAERALDRFRGLSSKIYIAFLVTAVVPVLVAGLVGIYFSLDALRKETLHHLEQEAPAARKGWRVSSISLP